MAEGVLRMECLSLWELCEGNLEGGLPPRDPKGYLEKSLGRVSLYIGALLLGNLEEGSSTEDCESRKGSRDGHLSLLRLPLGNLEESMLAGDFKGWMKGSFIG